MDELLFFGGEVKALGNGKVAGYLVRFGGPTDTDLEGEFFDARTDFGIESGAKLGVFYNHGLDSVLKTRRIGRGTVETQDAGLWIEAQLDLRDEYEQAIYALAEKGKLGWSSGAAGHRHGVGRVERWTNYYFSVGKSRRWAMAKSLAT